MLIFRFQKIKKWWQEWLILLSSKDWGTIASKWSENVERLRSFVNSPLGSFHKHYFFTKIKLSEKGICVDIYGAHCKYSW